MSFREEGHRVQSHFYHTVLKAHAINMICHYCRGPVDLAELDLSHVSTIGLLPLPRLSRPYHFYTVLFLTSLFHLNTIRNHKGWQR